MKILPKCHFSLLLCSLLLNGLVFAQKENTAPAGKAPTSAASTAEVATIIHQWEQAVGGGANISKAQSVHVRANKTERGVNGTWEFWLAQGKFKEIDTQFEYRAETLCDRANCRAKGWNGKVEPVEGIDAKAELSERAILELLYGRALHDPATLKNMVAAGEDETDKFNLLKYTPAGGNPVTLYIDKATSLPAKILRKPLDTDVMTELSDWRAANGVKYPHVSRQNDEEQGAETKVEVQELSTNVKLDPTVFMRLKDSPTDTFLLPGQSLLGIPFNFDVDHIMVLCTVNGSQPLWFLLDTGADFTLVNKARAEELKIKPFGASTVFGGGGGTEFAETKVESFIIGGRVEQRNQRMGVIDILSIEKIYGMKMGGLLGYDFLSRYVVKINYDTMTMDLFDAATYHYSGDGVVIPFFMEGGHPHTMAAISVPGESNIPGNMVIDSGAADTVNLTAPFVKAHRLTEVARKRPAGTPTTYPGMEKEFFAQTSVRGRLSEIALGKIVLKDIPINLQLGTKGAYASDTFAGTIGQGILHHYNTIYDYSRRVMILERNKETDTPFPPRKTFGITIYSSGPEFNAYNVTGVRKGSPAETIGFKTADVITSVDGKPAAQFKLAELRKMLLVEGSKHSFEIQRKDSAPVKLDFTVQVQSLDE